MFNPIRYNISTHLKLLEYSMSILKTFRNFKLSIFIIFILLSILSFTILNIGADFKKIALSERLQEQATETLKFDIQDTQTSQHLLKEHQQYMNVNYEKIVGLRDQDVIKNLCLTKAAVDKAFVEMGKSIKSLHAISMHYYQKKDKSLLQKAHTMQKQLILMSQHYNKEITQNIQFKNTLALYIALVNVVNVTLIFLWYSRKLTIIYRDVNNILNLNSEDSTKTFNTTEFTAIKRRMERRPLAGGGKNLLDPLTELLNEKGLLSEYIQRNSTSSKEFVCVTILDIDDFKELRQKYGKDSVENVIKKIAFIMNLEKKSSDILGRIEEDEFIIITPRKNQEDAFETVENIRHSIEKSIFKSPAGKYSVTVSGGFAPKGQHEKIESTIVAAKALARRAKIKGQNSIVRQSAFHDDRNLRM